MALKSIIPFPIFAPIPTTTTATPSTEIRFSRWNNANADKFERNRRTQQQIEDEIRRFRRFESAVNISTMQDSNSSTTNPSFKSVGTPSVPSLSSIPGKKSKYSKPYRNPNTNSRNSSHPAFRRVSKRPKFPIKEETDWAPGLGVETDIRVGENGLTYVVPGAPFEFMYSYTETPKNVKPIGLREPAVTPFGPGTMPRPWTGRKPLPGSKKELPQFDSFKVPEPGKKGVKPVQKPGPFLPGSGPKYVMSREEILGEPLTNEEIKELVEGCRKTKRQLNMGRDGLTHNMLDNIHAHWKRRRVCKIKCKGVCTVDMDNVCQQLEDRTGGRIIYRRGGSVYLFRGRNYNYKTRPRFPLMLWKPVTPVYPRLVKRVPDGLTLEQATEMRKKGRELMPICKLGKNGVYVSLVKNVREAFEACELVKINCQGLNPSDYRKIGAKLKDLVPCVLISFENEHILMWRGRDWTSSLLLPEGGAKGDKISDFDSTASHDSCTVLPLESEDEEEFSCSSNIPSQGGSVEVLDLSKSLADGQEAVDTKEEDKCFLKDDSLLEVNIVDLSQTSLQNETKSTLDDPSGGDINYVIGSLEKPSRTADISHDEEPTSVSTCSGTGFDTDGTDNLIHSLGNSSGELVADRELQDLSETSMTCCPPASPSCTEAVLDLLRQAVETGRAMILDGSALDADVVYERSVAFARKAPSEPIFRHRPQKVKAAIKEVENQKSRDLEADEAVPVAATVNKFYEKKSNEKISKEKKRTHKGKEIEAETLDVVPQGSLKIDELAKLLA
ncbi:unnamed protein product [Amaranthus hypochondriacus]